MVTWLPQGLKLRWETNMIERLIQAIRNQNISEVLEVLASSEGRARGYYDLQKQFTNREFANLDYTWKSNKKIPDFYFSENLDEMPAFYLAIRLGDISIVRALIIRTLWGEDTLLTVGCGGFLPLLVAAKYGHLELFKFFTEECGLHGSYDKDQKEYCTHVAAMGGHESILRYSYEKNHWDFFKKNESGRTVLHLAALKGHLGAVKLIMELGSRFNADPRNNANSFRWNDGHKFDPNELDNNNNSALHLASSGNHENVVQFFLKREEISTNVNAMNKDGETPIIVAARCDAHKTFGALLEFGVRIPNASMENNKTINLDRAFVKKYDRLLEKARSVISFANSSNNPKGQQEFSTCMRGDYNDKDVVLRNVRDETGLPLLHLAIRSGHVWAIQELLKNGAKVSEKNRAGVTAIDFAFSQYGLSPADNVQADSENNNNGDDDDDEIKLHAMAIRAQADNILSQLLSQHVSDIIYNTNVSEIYQKQKQAVLEKVEGQAEEQKEIDPNPEAEVRQIVEKFNKFVVQIMNEKRVGKLYYQLGMKLKEFKEQYGQYARDFYPCMSEVFKMVPKESPFWKNANAELLQISIHSFEDRTEFNNEEDEQKHKEAYAQYRQKIVQYASNAGDDLIDPLLKPIISGDSLSDFIAARLVLAKKALESSQNSLTGNGAIAALGGEQATMLHQLVPANTNNAQEEEKEVNKQGMVADPK